MCEVKKTWKQSLCREEKGAKISCILDNHHQIASGRKWTSITVLYQPSYDNSKLNSLQRLGLLLWHIVRAISIVVLASTAIWIMDGSIILLYLLNGLGHFRVCGRWIMMYLWWFFYISRKVWIMTTIFLLRYILFWVVNIREDLPIYIDLIPSMNMHYVDPYCGMSMLY